jgi:hypothetical protein
MLRNKSAPHLGGQINISGNLVKVGEAHVLFLQIPLEAIIIEFANVDTIRLWARFSTCETSACFLIFCSPLAQYRQPVKTRHRFDTPNHGNSSYVPQVQKGAEMYFVLDDQHSC